MATDAAEAAFPDGEWTNPGVQAALREAFDQGQEYALRQSARFYRDGIAPSYVTEVLLEQAEAVKNARMH